VVIADKRTILIVGNFLSEKIGIRTVCEDFADLLAKAGWSVKTTSRKTNRVLRLLDMLNTVWRYRKDYNLACIDTYSGMAFFWAEAVGFSLHLLGKPFILILHGGDLPKFSQRWARRVSLLLNSASAVTAPSRYLQETMQLYRADITVIPNPIELNTLQYRLRSNATPRIVWLRAFHKIYNPSLAPRVLAELKKQGFECILNMVGPDKKDGSLEATLQLAEKIKVRSLINIANGVPKNQVSEELSKGDIFINTTNVDNTPVSVIEAMACGLCIVSTNVGGISRLLEDGVDALLVPPDDQKAMAAAIQRILSEPGLVKQLSANAHKKAKQFDWAEVLPKWEEIFDRTIENA
jgi:glycosyltransferase involved in cell wall biosynthesis